jgi:DNA-binding LacI/PurR family transcriptional regulator/signal transduction histidine kinase
LQKYKRLGLLLDSIRDDYQHLILNGINNCATHANWTVVAYPGLYFTKVHGNESINKNLLIDLVDYENLDGLIILASSLTNHISLKKIEQVIKRFSGKPVVSIGVPMENMCSVVSDNYLGMYRIIEHLITVHKAQRIVFITGVSGNEESEIRFRAYQDALAAHSITYDERLVFQGDFWFTGGYQAAQLLLSERQLNVDAIVAANDYMAIGAIKELTARGVKIPEDVIVTGYDNVPDSKYVPITLTTVNQTPYNIGMEAFNLLVKLFEQPDLNVIKKIPVNLIYRESCGCAHKLNNHFTGNDLTIESESFDNTIENWFVENYGLLMPKEHFRDWTILLIDSIEFGILHADGSRLCETFEMIIRELHSNFADVLQLETLVFQLYAHVNKIIKDTELIKLFSRIHFEMLRMLYIHNTHYKNKSSPSASIVLKNIDANEFYIDVAFKREALILSLQNECLTYGVTDFYMSLLPENAIECDYLVSEIIIVDGQLVKVSEDEKVYSSRQLIPKAAINSEKRQTLVVFPLAYHNEQYGNIILNIDNLSLQSFEFLSINISRFLKSIQLFKQVDIYAKDLELQVEERTVELQRANTKLIASAHQAGMAEIAVEIIHNVGNILNSLQSSVESVDHKIKNVNEIPIQKVVQILKDKAVEFGEDKKLQLFLIQMSEYVNKIGYILKQTHAEMQGEISNVFQKIEHISKIIESQNRYAGYSKFKDKIDVFDTIRNVVSVLENQIVTKSIQIKGNYQKTGSLYTLASPSRLFHLFLFILRNAVEAMEHRTVRSMEVEITRQDTTAIINVSDTGEGIPEDVFPHIYKQGFTTKSGHSGDGLHSCANFVSEVGGSIKIESIFGIGTTVFVELPVVNK